VYRYLHALRHFEPVAVVAALMPTNSPMNSPTNPPHSPPARSAPRWIKWPLILFALGVIGALLWRQLPGAGYPTDLSKIGAGRATLVLTHDSAYLSGSEVMELMNGIRADYAGRVDFLVASLSMADARAFAKRHAARDGDVLLFAGDGRLLGMLNQPSSQDELRRAMAEAFGNSAQPQPR